MNQTTFVRIRAPSGELRSSFQPMGNPHWIPAGQATHLLPGDPVIGLEFNGSCWALPWWMMKNHHAANLDLDGRAVCVILCQICSSAAAFDPVIDGHRHLFRAEGAYNGSVMTIDMETGSFWTSFTGEAIEGPLKGRRMERLSAFQCTWQEWIELHPDSSVPDGEGESREGGQEHCAPGGPFIGGPKRRQLQHIDRRLAHYELVLGVSANGHARCYPLAELTRHGSALNDALGKTEIVIFSVPESWMASAYERRLDERSLSFRCENGEILDDQTGSRWDVSGVARSGALQGRRLRYLHSGVQEFYAWAAFHPATDIFRRAGTGAAPSAPGLWSGDAVPKQLSSMLRAHWWTRDMTMLHVGCGDGQIAAWLAEYGLEVHALDPDAELIARARRNFRGLRRLAFEVEDLCGPHVFKRQFDAILDHGYLASLAVNKRDAYAANVAAGAKPGARYLLLMPVAPNDPGRCQQEVRRLLLPTFRLIGHRALQLLHPETGVPVRSVGFRLERR